jgi:uncharacterized membrane protein YuzA (DUF378 family)
MKSLHMVAYVLLWAGGLNWGLVGLLDFNLVEALFGSWPALVTLVYVLVGVSTVYILATHKNYCKVCRGEMK